MKKYFFLAALLVAANVAAADLPCKVIGIADGDTLTCLTADHQSIVVRLAQIDAPEKHQPFGEQARQSLASMVYGQQVVLKPEAIDRYGRTVAQVWLGSQDVGRQQLRHGMAWVYRQYARDTGYDGAEGFAKSTGTGLWADPNPLPPWVWRQQGRQPTRRHDNRTPSAAPATIAPDTPWQPRRATTGFSCNGKTRCSQMSSCDEARFYLHACPNVRIDGDHDGMPCEAMCR